MFLPRIDETLTKVVVLAALASGLSLAACKRAPKLKTDVAPAKEVTRGLVMNGPVTGDEPAYYIRSAKGAKGVILYLPGRCTDVLPTLEAWGPAASEQGFVMMLTGDQPCPGSEFRHFSADPALIVKRFDAAVAALGPSLPGEIDASSVVLVGYSEGAARAEDVAATDPARFSRLILIGAPEAPRTAELTKLTAVATMAGEKDRHDLMLLGVQTLTAAHVPSKFFILPGAQHGEFGPEGARVMTEALDWTRSPK